MASLSSIFFQPSNHNAVKPHHNYLGKTLGMCTSVLIPKFFLKCEDVLSLHFPQQPVLPAAAYVFTLMFTKMSILMPALLSFPLSRAYTQLYPFTAPSIIPFTKFFCIQGYTNRMGSVTTIVIVILMDCAVRTDAAAPCCSEVVLICDNWLA